MYCNNCGEEIKEGAEFCPNCGTKVNKKHSESISNKGNLRIKNGITIKSKRMRIVITAIVVLLILINVFLIIDNVARRKYLYERIETAENEYNRKGLPFDVLDADITVKNYWVDEINVGDYITLGRYEQDNDSSDGVEDIEWRVLAKETSNNTGRQVLLVISRYALDCMPYNPEYEDVTWETCGLRNWLNNDFYYGAFTDGERNQIMTIQNSNPDASFYSSSYGGKGGNATSDNVFLLSFEQAENYFAGSNDRKCSPTDYAMWNGAHANNDDHSCYWWLRSPGHDQCSAMDVYDNGNLNYGSVSDDNGVRPALWIYAD